MNKYGFKQERNIIITNKRLYNLKKTTPKNKIYIDNILGITIAKTSLGFVIHHEHMTEDIYYISNRRDKIIEIIANQYEIIKKNELKLFLLNVKNLDTFVTKESEKKDNPKSNKRMPRLGLISLKEYLSGATKFNN